MARAFGIVTSSGTHIKVEGMQDYRPIGAFSFLGRYRAIDFPISNMSNSGIDRIQVYVRRKPRSLAEHLGTGRHYNINSKRGKLQLLFSENNAENNIYNTDIAAFSENLEFIERMREPYVIIAPSYMVYAADYAPLLDAHIESGADITLLYHSVDNAREAFLNCDVLNLNKQKGVESIELNRGSAQKRNVFMDTYIMKKTLFIELIRKARKISSMYTLPQIVNASAKDLDIRGIAHRGYFASLTDFKSYYDANISLINIKTAEGLFSNDWPIYTRTTDSCPTQYFDGANVKNSVISNGCLIEGTVENCVIGRGCEIKPGAVVKNSVILSHTVIGKNAHIENQVVDKWVRVIHENEIIAPEDHPGYIHRDDTLYSFLIHKTTSAEVRVRLLSRFIFLQDCYQGISFRHFTETSHLQHLSVVVSSSESCHDTVNTFQNQIQTYQKSHGENCNSRTEYQKNTCDQPKDINDHGKIIIGSSQSETHIIQMRKSGNTMCNDPYREYHCQCPGTCSRINKKHKSCHNT